MKPNFNTYRLPVDIRLSAARVELMAAVKELEASTAAERVRVNKLVADNAESKRRHDELMAARGR